MSVENTLASGVYTVECVGADGVVKWSEQLPNLVVNQGIQYMASVALTAGATAVTQITAWYIGLYGAGASNNPAAGDTMASHAGWTEIAPYSNATRPSCTFVAATTANPSVATNSASPAVFNINATATVGGAFLASSSAKTPNSGYNTGTLFSASDFTTGDRSVVSGDTLNVTYTFSLTAT
jgi:hypothetical protein